MLGQMAAVLLMGVLAAGWLGGCLQMSARLHDEIEAGQDVIVFVPGFKGSELSWRDTSKPLWITSSEALWGHQSLVLRGARFGLEAGPSLKPTGILLAVPVVPGIYSYDVYGKWLAMLRAEFPKRAVRAFAYDWRESNYRSAVRLATFIKSLKERGARRVSLIGHSMGGLICAYFLRYGTSRPEGREDEWAGARLVDQVVFAGVPFRGATQMIRDLTRGSKTVFNSDLLSAVALGSFPSSYQLLPIVGGPGLEAKNGDTLTSLIYDAANWPVYGWGLFHPTAKTTDAKRNERKMRFIKQALKAAMAFRGALHAPLAGEAPRLATRALNVVGRRYLTLARGVQESPGRAFVYDFDGASPQAAPGDGTVTAQSAALPQAYERFLVGETVESSAQHDRLFDDPAAAKAIILHLRGSQP